MELFDTSACCSNNLFCVLLTDIENFHPVYTEVEPFQDRTPRPVLIFGVAVEALIEQLLEEHPEAFVSPKTGKYIVTNHGHNWLLYYCIV